MLFLQNKFLDLAGGRGSRQCVHHFQIFGAFKFSKTFSEVGQQSFQGQRCSGPQFHDGLTYFSPLGSGLR